MFVKTKSHFLFLFRGKVRPGCKKKMHSRVALLASQRDIAKTYHVSRQRSAENAETTPLTWLTFRTLEFPQCGFKIQAFFNVKTMRNTLFFAENNVPRIQIFKWTNQCHYKKKKKDPSITACLTPAIHKKKKRNRIYFLIWKTKNAAVKIY